MSGRELGGRWTSGDSTRLGFFWGLGLGLALELEFGFGFGFLGGEERRGGGASVRFGFKARRGEVREGASERVA